jgi:hypothetical protein
MRRVGTIKVLKLWIFSHLEIIGLLPAAAIAIALVALLRFPIGPTEHFSGVVERIDYLSGRSGRHPYALVRLPGGSLATVRFQADSACVAGDTIRFQRQRRAGGSAYTTELFEPCAARR